MFDVLKKAARKLRVFVIPAWMRVSSAKDGFLHTLKHIHVTGFQHPCWNDGKLGGE